MEDDIYGDLENYNDVNALDELRNENKQLKFKLEEYASSMEKLQKDFDKLSSEFKKLEINYSSLLKTARAEIERKTQIINNLNVEKDKMILKKMQDSNKSIQNIKNNLLRDRNYKNKSEKDSDNNYKNKKVEVESKRLDIPNKRNEEKTPRLPSIDTTSSTNTDETNRLTIEKRPVEYKTSEIKENLGKIQSTAESIKSRRKSMPALSKPIPKLSSDDEYEDNSTEEMSKRDWLLKDEKSHKIFDRSYNDKYKHKTISETSGIDEKCSSYHESSRDTNYKGRIRNKDKYRMTNDKFEIVQRQRRLLTPERPHKRDHHDERSNKYDHERYRALKSPTDRYHTGRTRSRDSRSNYEKESPFDERPRSRHGRYGNKHKIYGEYDAQEPVSKRKRTVSSTRYNVTDKLSQEHEKLSVAPFQNLSVQYISCQSPDFAISEMEAAPPVREIMTTSAAPQEDPRLTSKKYVKKDEDELVAISTINCRNIDLQPIDTSKWDIPKVRVPDALQRPPDYPDHFVKELYTNIDDPLRQVKDTVTVSKENNLKAVDVITESNCNTIEDIHENPLKLPIDRKLSYTAETTEKVLKPVKYKIPKLKKLLPNTSNPLGKLLNEFNLDSNLDHKSKNDKLDADKLYSPDKNNVNKDTNDSLVEPHTMVKKSLRELVEGDLELSDETSDNVEHNHIQKKSTKSPLMKTKRKSQVKTMKFKITTNEVAKEPDAKKGNIEEIPVNTQLSQKNIVSTKEDTNSIKPKETNKGRAEEASVNCPLSPVNIELINEDIKKQKVKKKSKRQKVNLHENTKHTDSNVDLDEECVKKDSTAGIHSKFSDLFGDSSSLITPEDLGALPDQMIRPSNNTYVPIFEDAQDALDISVKIVQKAKTKDAVLCSENTTEDKNKTNIVKDKSTGAKKRNMPKKLTQSETTSKDDISEDIKAKGENPFINLNAGPVVTEVDIVSTVIISTGVQPDVDAAETINITKVSDNLIQPNIDINNTADNIISMVPKLPIALATSTPHKNLDKQLESDTKMPESSCNSSETKSARNEFSSSIEQSSVIDKNALNDMDIPDVRIFVKRRRKVVKKNVTK